MDIDTTEAVLKELLTLHKKDLELVNTIQELARITAELTVVVARLAEFHKGTEIPETAPRQRFAQTEEATPTEEPPGRKLWGRREW